MNQGEYSVSIKRRSAKFKDDAMETWYVFRDTKCDKCEDGLMTFYQLGTDFTQQIQCSECGGVGYTTKKVALSELGLSAL